MKKIILFIGLVLVPFMTCAQTARVQVIHNCADAAASTVDVYLNGSLLLDNFAFRTATPFIDAPAGVPLSIDVAPGNSTSVAQSLYNLTPTLADGQTYILVANGVVSSTGYNPEPAFELSVFAQGRETATDPSLTDILVVHGSTDAPTVDIIEANAGTIVNDISYPSFSPGYLEVIPEDYIIDVRDASGTVTVASYSAPLQTLGLTGTALTVVASGFLDPAQNSGGASFGLWVVLPTGGDMIPLPAVTPTARVQVIHNCADAAAATVDVYLNGALLIDNFAFRTATPYIDAPAGVPLSIDIAPGNSTSVAESIYNISPTLSAGETYVLVANGIVSASGYNPAQPFGLSVFQGGREIATDPMQTDVLINHGSSDAPTVDVVEIGIPAGTIVDDLSFPSFTSAYLELPTADYVLNVTDAAGTTVVATYSAPLAALSLQGQALTVLASGFLDPSQNSNGPEFGLWVALASGGNLIPLPTASPTARVQVIHNCADAAAATVDVYLNGTLLLDDFAFRTATPFVDAPAGVPVSIDVAPGNSTSVSQSINNFTPTLGAGQTYILVANGIVSASGYNPAPPFGLSVFAGGREIATNPAQTDILVNHGSTDAPTVDVVETSVPAGTIVDDLSFPSFTNSYLELPTADYTLNINDATGTVGVAAYSAPLAALSLQGQALTVLASGFLDPSQNSNGPEFGLWVALASGGNLIPLPSAPLAVQSFTASSMVLYPNPAADYINLDIPFSFERFQATIFDLSGRTISQFDSYSPTIDVSSLSAGVYLMNVNLDGTAYSQRFVIGN